MHEVICSTVLPNGMRFLFVEQDSPVVEMGIFVRQGSRNEEPHESGVSHFLEHLIANTRRAAERGNHSVRDILAAGGILNAHTTKEFTSYEGLALKEHAPLLFRALYELVFHPDLRPEDVETERHVILEELNAKLRSSQQLVDHLTQGIYGNMSYGNWVLGNEPFLNTVTLNACLQRYQSAYTADSTVVILMAKQGLQYLDLLVELFGQVPSGRPTPVDVPLAEEIHLKVIRQKSRQTVLVLGSTGPSARDEDAETFDLAMATWGSIPNAQLFNAIREREGLAYHIQTFTTTFIQTGIWGITAGISADNLDRFMEVVGEEIRRVRTEPLSRAEIARAVSVLKTHLYSRSNETDFVMRLIGQRAVFHELLFLNDLFRKYELADPDAIGETLRQYVRPERLSVVAIGNHDEETVLAAIKRMGDVL
jgi:predicted Zn-dependent peptidase